MVYVTSTSPSSRRSLVSNSVTFASSLISFAVTASLNFTFNYISKYALDSPRV